MNIDNLTLAEMKEISKIMNGMNNVNCATSTSLPIKVGDTVLVRTVTMAHIGTVKSIDQNFLVLENGGWLADSGRFSECLEKGTVVEFERAQDWFVVNMLGVIDIFPWNHEVPKMSV